MLYTSSQYSGQILFCNPSISVSHEAVFHITDRSFWVGFRSTAVQVDDIEDTDFLRVPLWSACGTRRRLPRPNISSALSLWT